MQISRILLASALLLHATSAGAADPSPNTPNAPDASKVIEVWKPVPPPPPMERHSTGMMVGGIVLTILGAGCAIGGTAAIIDDSTNGHGDFDGFQTAIVGLPLIGGAVIFSAIGIPLWVIGAREEPRRPEVQPPEARAKARPDVAVGPGGATLTWTF